MMNVLLARSGVMHYRRCFLVCVVALFFCGAVKSVAFGAGDVARYDVFETQVTNSKIYTNPFDFNVIELRATFTSPSGSSYSFFGFYDGDGTGAQTGNVWKLRFTPNETGNWSYTYSWTDGTLGGSGTFNVVEGSLSGPLQVASDKTWYFKTARGNVFDARGYSLHQYLEGKYGRSVFTQVAIDDLKDKINTKVADRGYNLLMVLWPMQTDSAGNHWWLHTGSVRDFSRFDIRVWKRIEQVLETAKNRNVHVFPFAGLVDQESARPNDTELGKFLRYYAARLGVYPNHFGHSLTWEYQDIMGHSDATNIMTPLQNYLNNLPIPPLLSVHDHSNNSFTGWLDFSMRQLQSRSVFDGNVHGGGIQGGVGSAFTEMPIIGSEDIWEYQSGDFGQPRNGTEVRRGAWGVMMAGVMPIYNETGLSDSGAPAGGRSNFSGQGQPEVRRMFDFFYSKTRYRQYQKLNSLVSSASRQIASGISGQEYLVYDEDGGSITIDLSAASGSTVFSVLWFDPKSGTEQGAAGVTGGALRSVSSPFSGDSVLLLIATTSTPDTTPPGAPQGLTVQ